MTERIGIGDIVAAHPHLAGYALSDAHVGIILLDQNSKLVTSITAEWADDDLARDLAENIVQLQASHGVDHAIYVGYGAEGQQRADQLAKAVAEATRTPPGVVLVHVEDGTYRATSDRESWGPQWTLPTVPAALYNDNVANSRDELTARYAPFSSPTFDQLNLDSRLVVDRERPAFQADVAKRNLETLARGGNPASASSQQAILAHLITSNTPLRDYVIALAVDNPEQRRALIALYQGAPESLRGQLATATAAAMWLAADGTPRVEAVLSHADPDAPLTPLIGNLLARGADPRRLGDQWVQDAQEVIREVDAEWIVPESTSLASSDAGRMDESFLLSVESTRIPGEGVFDLYKDQDGRELGAIQYREDYAIAAISQLDNAGNRVGPRHVGTWDDDSVGREQADRAIRAAIAAEFSSAVRQPEELPLTVYTTPECPGCKLTKDQFRKNGIDFREVDVTKDKAAQELLRQAGFKVAPVIQTPDGEMTGGYRPDRIKSIINSMAPGSIASTAKPSIPQQPTPPLTENKRGPHL